MKQFGNKHKDIQTKLTNPFFKCPKQILIITELYKCD